MRPKNNEKRWWENRERKRAVHQQANTLDVYEYQLWSSPVHVDYEDKVLEKLSSIKFQSFATLTNASMWYFGKITLITSAMFIFACGSRTIWRSWLTIDKSSDCTSLNFSCVTWWCMKIIGAVALEEKFQNWATVSDPLVGQGRKPLANNVAVV